VAVLEEPAARRAVGENPSWYHCIELAPGVITPGQVDLREATRRTLPASLRGARALDVGTFDGFWAFEMEKRGAAEVVAIDVGATGEAEWPPLHRARLEAEVARRDVELGRGFDLAARALGSRARRVTCSVYDLEPEAIGGPVDVAFCGALLLHLRDPVRALERIRRVLSPGGRLFQLEPFSVRATLRSPRTPLGQFRPLVSDFTWWFPNLSLLKAMPWAAGFADVRLTGFHRPTGPMGPVRHAGLASRAQ